MPAPYRLAGRYSEPLLDPFGNGLPGASVAIYAVGTTTPATLYRDATKATTAANPVTSAGVGSTIDALGNLTVFADPGSYDTVTTVGTRVGPTVRIVVPLDPAEAAQLGADGKLLPGQSNTTDPHPNLAAHDTLGLATQAELDTHAATAGHTHPNLAAHDTLGLATQAELDTHTGATTAAHGGIVASTDVRLADARTPTGAAGGVLAGTYPNPSFASDMATQVELDAHGHTTVPSTTITTSTHTAALADAGKVLRMTFAGASTLTIPANATVAFTLNTVINGYAAGGALTFAAAAGVTIRNNSAALAQYGEASLRKDGTDEWVRVG